MQNTQWKNKNLKPITLAGKTIARSFWGKAWCTHLENFAVYANRLPRGRTYLRSGAVRHLELEKQRIEALVRGTELYRVAIDISSLPEKKWMTIKDKCRGQIDSMLQLLRGSLSRESITVICNPEEGLFPQVGELHFSCSCPDTAEMCKHIAAVLYGIGNRLDTQPELLFLLRGVDATELIAAETAVPSVNHQNILESEDLSALFGIELESIPERKKSSETRPELDEAQVPQSALSESLEREKSKSREALISRETLFSSEEEMPVQLFFIHSSEEYEKTFTGKDIVRLRARACLSVSQFAQLLGVTRTTVYRWEHSGVLNLQAASKTRLLCLMNSLREKNNPNKKVS